jgi:hypothetical protein
MTTKRHNRLAEVVRRALIRFIGTDMQSEIRENQGVGKEGLTGELNPVRPDVIVERINDVRRKRRGREEKKKPSKSLNSHAHMVAFHTEGTHLRKSSAVHIENCRNGDGRCQKR